MTRLAVSILALVIMLLQSPAQLACDPVFSPCEYVHLPIVLLPPPTPTIAPTPTIEPTLIPTEVPPPTATPQAPDVRVINIRAFVPYQGSTSVYIVGEVKNDTPNPVAFIKLNFVLRAQDNTIVDGDWTYAYLERLLPGMSSPFTVILTPNGAWNSYEWTLTWSATDRGPTLLEVSGTEMYFDSYSAVHVRGRVRNQFSTTKTFIWWYLAVHDKIGNVIGTSLGVLSPSDLLADQSVPFDVDSFFWDGKPDRNKIGGFSLYFEPSEFLSQKEKEQEAWAMSLRTRNVQMNRKEINRATTR